MVKTRFGYRFLAKEGLFPTRAMARESHSFQAAVCLADLQVAVATPLGNSHKPVGSVSDIVNDLVASFTYDDAELEWTTVAICAYARAGDALSSKSGVKIDLSELVNKNLDGPLTGGCCGGMHRVRAYFELLRADLLSPRVTPEARTLLVQRCVETLRLLLGSQCSDGSFTAVWSHRPESEPREGSLVVTAHVAEVLAGIISDPTLSHWVDELDSNGRPPPPLGTPRLLLQCTNALGTATIWLLNLVERNSELEALPPRLVCPMAHALAVIGVVCAPE